MTFKNLKRKQSKEKKRLFQQFQCVNMLNYIRSSKFRRKR